MHADYTIQEYVTRRTEWVITNPPVNIRDFQIILNRALNWLPAADRNYDDALHITTRDDGDGPVIVIYANERTETETITG